MKTPIFIAEVKTQSPFGWRSDKTWGELFLIADKYGDWLSIHTDPRWGGSFDLIKKARSLTRKPILAKGIHARDVDIERAIQAGADYVLVVGRVPKVCVDKCLVEVNDLSEFAKMPKGVKAVWNQRDLANGSKKTETFAQARKQWTGWLAQASFIDKPQDIKLGADAFIVGTNLSDFIAKYAP